jgi:hypothetical protein
MAATTRCADRMTSVGPMLSAAAGGRRRLAGHTHARRVAQDGNGNAEHVVQRVFRLRNGEPPG